MVKDDLGKRQKAFYEEVPKTRLMRRTPVIIRVDGKAFHTFCRGFAKPYDDVLIKSMQETMQYMCKNIQGCKLGYVQSDEISLLLIDYDTFTTGAWFDYEVQKMTSVAASMATMAFNKAFSRNVKEFYSVMEFNETNKQLLKAYEASIDKGAMFDARVYNVPREEVTNYFYWRQLDASRNSIEMLGQSHFSPKQLHKKSCNDIQDMLIENFNINWNDVETVKKRGSCCFKKEAVVKQVDNEEIVRYIWIIDKEIPIFKGADREYIDKWVYSVKEINQ
jgi:tRNA(His) 5'-end guanylyltransferase